MNTRKSLRKCVSLVWFGLVCPSIQSHLQHWTRQLQITIYNTTYSIRTSTQYNVINNNKKFKGLPEVEFITTSGYMCIYINILKS